MTSFIAQDAFSILNHINRLLDELSHEYRKKVLSFCIKNNWKLSAQDIDIIEPNYDELKLFMLHEMQIS